MTTAAKPLPAHGTYARANGSPGRRAACNCPPCRAIRLRTKKRYKVNKELGRAGRIPADVTRAHLKLLQQTMTWPQIGALAGCEPGNLQQIAAGHVPVVRATTQEKVLSVKPQPTSEPGKFVDSTGTIRRIQALRAHGYSPVYIAQAFGLSETHVRRLATGDQPTVRYRIAVKVAAIFAELATTPAPRGVSATMARNYARAHGWAPPGAWDDIDDPTAVPDWTGHCGTDRGWWLHTLKHIPGCESCETAHQQWKQEHSQLDRNEFMRRLGQARAAATTREADLAHDARELLRLGADIHQAAERLGVTRNHLQQAMLRHPDTERTAA